MEDVHYTVYTANEIRFAVLKMRVSIRRKEEEGATLLRHAAPGEGTE